MQEIRCPNCGEVFQVDETGYEQIAQQVRNKEFEKELERRQQELEAQRERELQVVRLQEQKQKDASIAQRTRRLQRRIGKSLSFKCSWKPMKRERISLYQKHWKRRTQSFLERRRHIPIP